MARHFKSRIFVFCLLLIAVVGRVGAVEIIHYIDSKDYARVMANATGLKIADDGTVYVTSAEKGTLLTIVDGEVEVRSLKPKVFKDNDLGGINVLPNGQLVVVNEDSGQVAIINSELEVIERFAQSGGDAGELKSPGPVAVSINQKIYVGDVKNKRVSVFNQQGLFLYTIGRGGTSGDLKEPRHVSIDAEENVYVLEGEGRISIFNVVGELLARFTPKDLKQYFGQTPKFSALTVDLDGNLYIGDRVQRRITVFDWRNLKVLKNFGSVGMVRGQYRIISYLSINARGQLAVLDKKNKKVEVYQLEQKSFAAPVTRDLIVHGLTIDSACVAQYVFIDDQTLCLKPKNKGIVILAADGSEQGRFGEAAQKPGAIHVGAKTVGIIDNNTLHAFKHDGSHVFSIGRYGSLAGGFNKPSDVFVHGGKYYVVDKGNKRVQVFGADGLFLEEIKDGKGRKDGERNFIKVGPIAVDNKENLYIADGSELGQIHVFDKERNKIATIGSKKDTSLKVTRFYDIDIDQQDRLYVLAGSDFNDFGVRVYRDFKPYKTFGAAGKNNTQVYFEEATSLSVLSGSSNSVYVNDVDRKKMFRFDLLEYPDAAFGLNIAANYKSIDLTWSSSKSPLIEEYEIQAANAQIGPYKPISSSRELSQTLSAESAGAYTWFRIVAVSGHGLQAVPSAPRENHFQNLRAMYQIEKYDEAVKLADRLLKIAPDNADALDLLAMSLFHQQDYTRAISEFRQLADIKSYRIKAIQYQVKAYYELEQFLDARALIEEVLDEDPAEVEPYLICTRLSLELADAIGAVSCAEDGLEKHEQNVELRYLLGRAYIEAGIAEDALLEFETIVENNPDNHEIRLKIAEEVYRMGDYPQALEHFEAVLAANPGSGAANLGKARSLLSLDRDDEAKSIAVKLSGKKASKGAGYYLLGKIAAKSGNHKEAVLRLTRAGKDSSQVVDVWISLANAYSEINQPKKAVKSLAKGIDSNPEAFELYQLAGQLELKGEKYPEANEYLDKAVQLQPQSLESRRLYARSLFATRNYRSAAIHADAAARIAPESIDVLVLQADIANQQGKTGSAIEFLKTAISIDTASPELQYQIGRVYQDANLFDASREHLERAAAIRPNWAEPHVALGNLYSKRRLFDDAVTAYEKAVELDPSEANRSILNVAFAERKKSLEFANNAPQLTLSDLNLETVFSAAYKNYQDKPIGNVKLRNVAATEYGNLKLSFQIKEFMDFPTTVEIPRISGLEVIDIPIKATFNNRILEVDEDTGVQVEVKLTYLRDGQKDDITLTQPMTIYGKNAIVWGNAQMIGSFVTPKDDTLRDYVRQVVNSYLPEAGPLNQKLVSAMAYFSSLTASGTNYIIDPNTPFTELRDDQIDYVQFPRETLHLKSGDCDDLSVLISAGLENLGIRTAFLEIPGHLFLMFDTGLGVDEADLISQDSSLLAIKDGSVWIPLEATMVNTNFNEAWAEGARKYQVALAADELGIIDLKEAWKTFKPVTLRKASYSIDLPEAKRTESLVRQSRKLLLAKSIDRLVLPYQTMVVNNPKNVAARLQIAILYARYGLYEDAELAFESLNELAPGDSAVKTNQGNMYFLQQDFKSATQYYQRAIELDGEDGGIWINLSMAQFKAGELKQARNSYQNAVQINARFKEDYSAYSKLLSN
jgi:tetratricopeptide (TPR) repeat protein/DNA-binding beta-propeller fold protein YncE